MENELNLIDYIHIALKNRRLIIVFAFVGLILGCIYFIPSQVEKANTVISISSIGKDPVENAAQMINKINLGFYGTYSGLKAIGFAETNLIKIEVLAKNRTEASQKLDQIASTIIQEQNSQLDAIKEAADKKEKELAASSRLSSGIIMLDGSYFSENIKYAKLIRKAEITPASGKLNIAIKIFVCVLLGAFLGLCFVFLRNWWIGIKKML